jgi:restriction system protein
MANFETAHAAMEARGPIFFAGRKEELLALDQAVFSKGLKFLSVEGVGGIGKTSLIREFQRLNQEKFPGGVVWLNGKNINQQKIDSNEYIREIIPAGTDLVVIDDFEQIACVANHFIRKILWEFPLAKVIVASRLHLRRPDAKILLNDLSLQDMADVWASNLADFSDADVKRLYKAVGGNPLAATLAGRLVRDGRHDITDFEKEFEEYISDFQYEGVIAADGNLIQQQSAKEVELVSGLFVASDEVLRYLHRYPEKMNQLTPRQFEEFIAELLVRQGYEIQLTPITRDGGKDIYAARRDALGTFLYVVECKKNSPVRPVDVGVVRQLYGVVQEERVSGGIIATTSYFSKDAKKFCDRVKYQVNLKDYVDIQKWLNNVVHLPRNT